MIKINNKHQLQDMCNGSSRYSDKHSSFSSFECEVKSTTCANKAFEAFSFMIIFTQRKMNQVSANMCICEEKKILNTEETESSVGRSVLSEFTPAIPEL